MPGRVREVRGYALLQEVRRGLQEVPRRLRGDGAQGVRPMEPMMNGSPATEDDLPALCELLGILFAL